MPAEAWKFDVIKQAERCQRIAEGMRGKRGIGRPGEREGIHPRAETMKRKDAQKSLFRGGSMGHDPAFLQTGFNAWPKIDEARRAVELGIRNAMNLLGRPSDRTRGAEMGIQRNEWGVVLPVDDGHLNRLVCKAWSRPRALEIDRGERDIRGFHAKGGLLRPSGVQAFRKRAAVVSQSMQASVMETPYFSVEGSVPSGWAPKWR